MAIYIYPQNYEEPVIPPPIELTPSERATVKNRMQIYITNQNRPILLRELVDTAQQWLINVHNKHVRDSVLREIALEIREEWGYPGQS